MFKFNIMNEFFLFFLISFYTTDSDGFSTLLHELLRLLKLNVTKKISSALFHKKKTGFSPKKKKFPDDKLENLKVQSFFFCFPLFIFFFSLPGRSFIHETAFHYSFILQIYQEKKNNPLAFIGLPSRHAVPSPPE